MYAVVVILDQVIALNEEHLRRVVGNYVSYYLTASWSSVYVQLTREMSVEVGRQVGQVPELTMAS